MTKFQIYLLTFLLFASCAANEESVEQVLEDTTTSTTITTSTTTTTTTVIEEEKVLNEYGQEIIEMSPDMKEQFNELISFVEKRTGLKFTEYPKYELYTLEGYRDYSVASYLDDFEEDYEEGEWERAVLSENMWGLTTKTPEEMKELYVDFVRCASSGSYSLDDKILRVPIKKNQKKLNLFEQSVLVHELTHTLQGQIIDLSAWYNEMKEADDFSDYYGRRSIMEGQADLVQARWESGLDAYDRQTMQSQYPAGCGISLPEYIYIPFDLYYGYGPRVVKEIYNQGGMEALNEALYSLPTSEQIYSIEKYYSSEPYQEVLINDLSIEGYSLVDEGTMGSLDIVYLLQPQIGQATAVNAAIGIGGGSWKDYEDENDNLLMTVKINGDSDKELAEIYDSYISWAEAQSRFSPGENSTNTSGKLYIGDTNFWIENNNGFVRLILSQDLDILVNILTNCSSGSCKKDF